MFKKFLENLVSQMRDLEYYDPLLDLEESEDNDYQGRLEYAEELCVLNFLVNYDNDSLEYRDTVAAMVSVIEEYMTNPQGTVRYGGYFHKDNIQVGVRQKFNVFYKSLVDAIVDDPVQIYVESEEYDTADIAVISGGTNKKLLLTASVRPRDFFWNNIKELEAYFNEYAYEIQNAIIAEEIKKNAVNSMNYIQLKALEYDSRSRASIEKGEIDFNMESMLVDPYDSMEFTTMWGGENQEYLQRIEDKLEAGASLGDIKEIIAIEVNEGEHDIETFAKFLEALEFPKLAEMYRKIQAEKEVAA